MFKNINSLATLFTPLQSDQIAKECRFIQRNFSQVKALSFILTLLKSLYSGDTSFRAMASYHSKLQIGSISRQALHKRINRSAVTYLSRWIQKIISTRKKNSPFHDINKHFNRILLEDCTVLTIHKDNKKYSTRTGTEKQLIISQLWC